MASPRHERTCRILFFVGYITSLAGDWLCIAALGWLMREEMNLGGTAYGFVSAMFALAFLVASPIAGKVIRERSLLSVLILVNLIQCLCSYVICFGASSHTITFSTIVAIRVISGACSSFKEVGDPELLKRLLGEHESKRVINWTSSSYYFARAVLGYFSALILIYLSTAWLFGFDGTTFLIMSMCLGLMTIVGGHTLRDRLRSPFAGTGTSEKPRETMLRAVISNFRSYGEAFRLVKSRPDLYLLILLTYILEGVCYTCWLLAPTIVRVSFNEDSGFWYGMFLSISGIGGIFGMFFYTRAVKRRASLQRKIFVALALMNVFFVALLSVTTSALQFSIVYACAIFCWAPYSSYVKTYFLHQKESALANSALQCTLRGVAPLSRWLCVSIAMLAIADPQMQILACAGIAALAFGYILLLRFNQSHKLLVLMFNNPVFNPEMLEPPVDETLAKT